VKEGEVLRIMREEERDCHDDQVYNPLRRKETKGQGRKGKQLGEKEGLLT